MPSDRDSDVAFTDNWAYLKTELNWLDRILRQACARSQEETKDIDRVARTKGDRATSHWWKGIISLSSVGYDDFHAPYTSPGTTPPRTYQQQLEARIEASKRQGIVLGLPQLCDRIQLSVFEKNAILMSLAPEVNRRFSRLYGYLQGDEHAGLPTVDLILRLLCRGDAEWRAARLRLSTSSPLKQLNLVEFLPSRTQTFLSCRLKLTDTLTNYLLAEVPDSKQLEMLLLQSNQAISQPPHRLLKVLTPAKTWSDLVIPPAVQACLENWLQQWQYQTQVDEIWGFGEKTQTPGILALLAGVSGTGKTTTAEAIAQALQYPLYWVDLALLHPQEHAQLLAEISLTTPPILLLKSAQIWLGRHSVLSSIEIAQFFQQRQQERAITLFTVERQQSIRASRLRPFDAILELPMPSQCDRLRLWRQAFPKSAPLDTELDWEWLAQQWQLTGGEISAIARQAAFLAATQIPNTPIQLQHIVQAWEQRKQQRQRLNQLYRSPQNFIQKR